GAREQFAVVVQGGRRRQQRRRELRGLAARHERDRQHPRQRRQAQRRQRQQRRVDAGGAPARLPDRPAHSAPLRRPKRSSSVVAARITTNSTKAMAEARPRFHQRKPSSNMWYSTL